MTKLKLLGAGLMTFALATGMHLDWHVARPVVHHLSLGWREHWLLALPTFGLTALYVLRTWPERVVGASAAIIGGATFLAGVAEPAWEYWAGGATLEWAFGRARLVALGTFLAAGLITYLLLVSWARWRARVAG